MGYKYMSRIKCLFLFAIVISCLSCALFINAHTASAKAKITVKKSSSTSRDVKFKVTGKDIIGIDVSEFYYYDSDDTDHEITKAVKFKQKSDGSWEAAYTCSKGAYGDYIITLTIMDANGSTDEVSSDFFTYKSDKKDSDVKVKIGAAPKQAYIPGIGTFDSFYNIDKSGKELFVKTGETITVDVLYRASDKKLVRKDNVKLKWGGKTLSPSSFESQSKKDSDGLYNIGAKFRIKTDSDMDGELIAYYEGSKNTSRSLGIKLDSDGTAPAIKIDKKYGGSGTNYYKEPVSVPITITEKNFVDSNAKVTVNGKKVNVSWRSNGTEHKTNIKLSEGENVIEISAFDKAGNDAKKAKSATLIIDTERPSVSIEGFENGTGKGLKNGEIVPYPISVTISDETSLANESVELYRIAEDDVTRIPVELQRNQNGNTVTYSIDDLKDDGYYTIAVTAKDSAGNKPSAATVRSEGENPYNVDGGKVSGSFTVNRQGSLYKVENDEHFAKPLNEIPDFVIYEYNKNEITECVIEIIDSIGTTILTPDQYTFEMVESDEAEYKYKYKYTISSSNFSEGYYSIQINSKSIAGDNGSLITRTEESSSINKTIIIDKTPPEIILFEGTTDGQVKVKVRDNNMDESSVKLSVDGTEYPELLTVDVENSTSTNVVYTGDVGINPENAKIVLKCKDLAGNSTESEGIVIHKASMLKTYIIFGGLGAALIVLVVVTIIIIINVKKQR